ncbi:MAG TPA: hypothetical protein DCS07_13360 [Bdellovibrionales bacterium]|nr:hypothetical protein [Bdellovibrionales bacterium]
MVRFALKTRPDWACLVPEKRREVTTEGGLDVIKQKKKIAQVISKLQKGGVRVSLFVEPDVQVMKAARELGADAVELHTGRYCLARQGVLGRSSERIAETEFKRIQISAILAKSLGLHVHAGHGFDLKNVSAISGLQDQNREPLIEEFNIGHSIICRAVLVGLEQAVHEMLAAIGSP